MRGMSSRDTSWRDPDGSRSNELDATRVIPSPSRMGTNDTAMLSTAMANLNLARVPGPSGSKVDGEIFARLEQYLESEHYPMDELHSFIHTTVKENAQDIVKANHFKSDYVTMPNFSELTKIRIKGVWFSPTLFNMKEPTRSPYGDIAFSIPIKELWSSDVGMFYDTVYRFRKKKHPNQGANQAKRAERDLIYVRLIAVSKKSTALHAICEYRFPKVDLAKSRLFRTNGNQRIYSVHNPCPAHYNPHDPLLYDKERSPCGKHYSKKMRVWVEVLWVCEDGIRCNFKYYEVEDTKRQGENTEIEYGLPAYVVREDHH